MANAAEPKGRAKPAKWVKATVPYATHDGVAMVPGWSMGGNFAVVKPEPGGCYRVAHIPSGLGPGTAGCTRLKNAKALAEMAASLLPAEMYDRNAADPSSRRPEEVRAFREAGHKLRARWQEIEFKRG